LKYHGEVKEKHESTVIELREDYQYGVLKEVGDKDKIPKLVGTCTELIDLVKDEVYKAKI
jgi:hypothetical protein